MKKSKLVSALAVLIVLTIMVTSCSSNATPNSTTPSTSSTSTTQSSTTGTQDADTNAESEAPLPSKITMFSATPLASSTPLWSTPVGQKVKEMTGVELDIEYLVGSDLMTKANLMVSSGVYPDLVYLGEATSIFTTAEALIPLDDLIDKYGTNIKKIYRPNELELAKSQYGQTYIIPTQRPSVENLYPGAGFYVAYDVLKDAGFPVISTISQYAEVIKNYIEKNPTYEGQPTIGFTLPTEGTRSSAMEYGASRYLSGFPNDGVTQVNQDTLEANIVMTQHANKEFLKFMNEMWNLGYVDKEIFMQKDDQYKAKIASGRVVGFYDQRWGVQDALNSLEKTGKDDRQFVAFPVVTDDATQEAYRGSYAIVMQGVGITNSCKDPEGVFRFLDRFTEDDIQKLTNWGIEGVDYSLDDDGKFTRTPEQWAKSFDIDYQNNQGFGSPFSLLLPHREMTNDEQYAVFDDGNWCNANQSPEYAQNRYKDYEKQILEDYKIETLCDFFNPMYPAKYQPGWAIRQTIPQDSEEFISVTKALELANEWHAKITQAPTADFEALYEEYQTKLKAIPGLLEYEAEATRLTQESAQYYK